MHVAVALKPVYAAEKRRNLLGVLCDRNAVVVELAVDFLDAGRDLAHRLDKRVELVVGVLLLGGARLAPLHTSDEKGEYHDYGACE